MKVLEDNFNKKIEESTFITLGSFDGIHLGHQELIKTLVEKAKDKGIKSMVYTFSNHPMSILAPEKEPKHLMTNEKKIEILSNMKVDIVNFAHFDKEYLKIKAEDFVRLLVEHYNMKGIVVGFNNRFGHKNTGDVELLKNLSTKYNYELIVINPYKNYENIVSSTRIRNLIENGDMETAKELLGREYSLTGKIVRGRQLGRKMGFPTANLEINDKMLLPKRGIYYSNVVVDSKVFKGITSVGYNPTVNGNKLTVETNILNFNKDIYGDTIEVYFIERTRDEIKFNSIDDLIVQLHKDKKNAEEQNYMINKII